MILAVRQNFGFGRFLASDKLWENLFLKTTDFKCEARILLAVKLYESGKLTTGLAARIANVSRVTFIRLLGQFELSPFGETTREIPIWI